MAKSEQKLRAAIAEPARLADYLAGGGMAAVGGMCSPEVGYLTWQIGVWQTRRGITGDIAEIGVHHGRFFLLLALLRHAGERAVAIDVFGQQHLNVDRSGEGDRAIFEAAAAQHLGGPQGLVIHEADSLALPGCDLLSAGLEPTSRVKRSFRLFSVDGSHTAKHTMNDMEVAFGVLRDGGLVIVDDFYNDQWPGVQEGVHAFLDQHPEAAAVAYGENKLFLCRARDHADYLNLFRRDLGEFLAQRKDVELHGRPAVMFRIGRITAPFDRELRRRPMLQTSFGQGGESVVSLVSGWSGRERGGTWMTETRAVAQIELPEMLRQMRPSGAELHLSFHPLLHAERRERHLRITTSFGEGFEGRIGGARTVVFRVPGEALAGVVTFEFEGDAPEAPAAVHPGSGDRRPLSFRFGDTLIALDPEEPA